MESSADCDMSAAAVVPAAPHDFLTPEKREEANRTVRISYAIWISGIADLLTDVFANKRAQSQAADVLYLLAEAFFPLRAVAMKKVIVVRPIDHFTDLCALRCYATAKWIAAKTSLGLYQFQHCPFALGYVIDARDGDFLKWMVNRFHLTDWHMASLCADVSGLTAIQKVDRAWLLAQLPYRSKLPLEESAARLPTLWTFGENGWISLGHRPLVLTDPELSWPGWMMDIRALVDEALRRCTTWAVQWSRECPALGLFEFPTVIREGTPAVKTASEAVHDLFESGYPCECAYGTVEVVIYFYDLGGSALPTGLYHIRGVFTLKRGTRQEIENRV